ncbi:larval/pupal cuticle protein H1C-like [Plodia interpunctella]|uniref:larval/pupal cuticle protein H1C-like n=1 Tax=Plodia interpunctella TaxID=58824 RepID=UPI003100FDA8
MYKLIVFAALLAVAAAAPGLLGAPYAAPLASPWGAGYVGAPLVSAGVVKTVAPVATSYANTVRIASPAVVAAHAPLVAAHAPIVASPYAHAWYANHINTLSGEKKASVNLVLSIRSELTQTTMNSLVVLLSILACAVAKPSGLLNAGVISYAAPAIASLPAAVSQQSRVDIKSSPAVISTAAVAPIARTIIAEPAVIAPPVVAAPAAAVSSQSRIDIKSSPAVFSSYAAAAPLAYSTPIAAPALIKTAIAPAFAAPAFAARAGFLAPSLVAPGVPLDTPEVIAARAAHFEAKALAGAHLIHKRSAPLIGAPVLSTYSAPLVSTYSAAPVVSTYAASPLISAYSAPLAYSTS